ncbi:MAG: flavin reductase [Spirochaetaceae bacterium]|nr:flavin reductase [Spirochaetaceae bacterium]
MEQKKAIPAGTEWETSSIRSFRGSPVERIADEWMLITCGDKTHWNTMTASWGSFGELWGKDVVFMFIRPTRHTFEFANAAQQWTLSFFDTAHHRALEICGAKSGRDTDKAEAAGLTPIEFADGSIGFTEAAEVVTCRKLYTHDFVPEAFLDPAIEKLYPKKDYHRMFVGEVSAFRVRR